MDDSAEDRGAVQEALRQVMDELEGEFNILPRLDIACIDLLNFVNGILETNWLPSHRRLIAYSASSANHSGMPQIICSRKKFDLNQVQNRRARTIVAPTTE